MRNLYYFATEELLNSLRTTPPPPFKNRIKELSTVNACREFYSIFEDYNNSSHLVALRLYGEAKNLRSFEKLQ